MAAAALYCKVISVGPAEDGKVYIWLKDTNGSFESRYFYAVDAEKAQMLATGLTAITSGLGVSAYLADTAENSQVNRLYLQAGA
jgi:hypothetical protein